MSHPYAAMLAALLATALTPAAGAADPPEVAPRAPARAEGRGGIPVERPDDPEMARPAPLVSPPKTAAAVTRNGFTSVQVNVDADGANIRGDAANEPSIAIDPTAPNRIVVGWRQFNTVSSNFREAGVAFSNDGGRTWTFPGVLEDGVFRSDPVLEFDNAGRVHYLSLGVPGGDLLTDVFTSDDGGATWSPPVASFGGDKEWFVIEPPRPGASSSIVEVWSPEENLWDDRVVTRSTDGGSSFEYPFAIDPVPAWGSMAVGPNRELYIVGNASLDLTRIVLQRSFDALNPEVATPTFKSFEVPLGGAQASGQGSLETPNPVGMIGQIWIAVDTSDGPRRGTLYVVASVDPPGPDPCDVHFVRSADRGRTWSAPVRIHEDGHNRWQWFATMSAAPDGRLDVVWIENLDDNNAAIGELRFSQSSDGGDTWSEPIAVTPPFSSRVGWPNQQKLGDYYHMRSDLVGADLIYAATFNGEQDVYYLRLGDRDCNSNGVGDAADLAAGTLADCDDNDIPDTCEIAARPELDKTGEGILDVCQPPRRSQGRIAP